METVKPNNQQIKAFARNVLGCQCPDKVFQNIITLESSAIGDGLTVEFLINIGDRLIIAIQRHHQVALLSEIEKIFNLCRLYREQGGFNRFRYVIPIHKEEIGLDLQNKIYALNGIDDQMHFHLIDQANLPIGFK